jgi:hypothetical protein
VDETGATSGMPNEEVVTSHSISESILPFDMSTSSSESKYELSESLLSNVAELDIFCKWNESVNEPSLLVASGSASESEDSILVSVVLFSDIVVYESSLS